MSQGKIYGHIPNHSFGATFRSRDALCRAGVHAMSQAGIHGDPNPNGGAYSICLSGGYEDNKDKGDTIIYVGSGGQDEKGQQIMDQTFDDPPNKALEISFHTKRPVRVTRGKNDISYYSPSSGYRYDGLYVVDKAEMKRGKKGFNMCFFELRRIREEGDGPIPNRRLLSVRRLKQMARGPRRK